MGVEFRIRDFGYPFSILKLKRTFDRNQWLSEEALKEYQSARLRHIITHAYANVPYYQKLFRENSIRPGDIQTVADLKKVPFLTRDLLKRNTDLLVASNAKKYKPASLSTSGTTGGKINFYADKPSNVLEFVYYWRSWGWAGYKLGDTFALLTSEDFVYTLHNREALYNFNAFIKQLTVNSMLFSHKYLDDLIAMFRKFRPLFLKGFPTNLYMLALVLNEKRNHGITCRAIFSQGGNLLPYQRDMMEKVFSCKVYDSYGHMERTAAISQCPFGSYHIHQDYGIVELEEPGMPLADDRAGDTCIREVVGTSLHNYAMPLIRYRTGDFVTIKSTPEQCSCKRSFPTIVSVIGRDVDLITTRDKRKVAGLFSVFSHAPGIIMGQIIQEAIDRIHVKLVCEGNDAEHTDRILAGHIRQFVGDDMHITIEHTTVDGIRKNSFGKFKLVISHIPSEEIFSP
jgi:phenylacetate-CoA ligase